MSAKPWLVIQREMRTPMAASLFLPTQAPVSPGTRSARTPNPAAMAIMTVLEVADVAVDVAAIGAQIQDRVADQLAGSMVGDVAAPARLEQRHAGLVQRLVRREHVRAVVADLGAEGNDRRVLEQEELVGDPVSLSGLDEGPLELQRLVIGHHPQPTDLKEGQPRF